MQDKRFRNVSWLWALVVAALFSWLNRAGLVITHDSLFYLEGAQQLLDGKGFYNYYWGNLVPDTHYGPVYSFGLAVLSWMFGWSPEQAALGLMAMVIFLNIGLFARILNVFELKPTLRYFFLFLLPCLPPFWLVHTHAWSEALYLFFLLLAITLSLKNEGSLRWYGIGLLLGFSVLVRFSGLFMLPLFGLWILAEKQPFRKKIAPFIGFSALALLPFVLWTVRNQLLGSEMSSRVLFWQWTGFSTYRDAANTVLFWLGISVPLLIGITLSWRKLFASPWILIGLIYPFIYVSLLVLAKSTIDREIPMDSRLLSALLPILWLVMAASWSKMKHAPWLSWVAVLAVLLSLGQFMRPAGQLYERELGLQHNLLKTHFEQVKALQPPLSPTDTLYCLDFDFNYLKNSDEFVVRYYHSAPEQAFYFTRITAPLPKNLTSGAWEIDTLLTDRLYYITPANHP